MSILFICFCGCLTILLIVYDRVIHLAAETAVRVAPGLCLSIVLTNDHDVDEDDDGEDDDGEDDDGDEGEVDNCLKDSDEKPDGGDPPGPHPQSSHLTHPCFYANCGNMCDVVLSFKCSNILLF